MLEQIPQVAHSVTPEELAHPQETQITPEIARNWVIDSAEMDLFDKPVVINRNGVEEKITIDDAVLLKRQQADGSFSYDPIVTFKKDDGSREEMLAQDFLQTGNWLSEYLDFKQNKSEIQSSQEATRQAEIAERQATEKLAKQEEEERWAAKLFAPIIRPENNLEHPGYGHMLSDDPDAYKKYTEYDKAESQIRREQERHDKFITPGSREHAARILGWATKTDEKLKTIVDSQVARLGLSDPLDIVDALRTDPEMRLTVGKYFLEKVNNVVAENYNQMPQRVVRNTGKNPDNTLVNLSGMRSRDYVALLCLAKIDGSFNVNQEDNSTSYDERGVARVGQHRYAADLVMEAPVSEFPQVEYIGDIATEQVVEISPAAKPSEKEMDLTTFSAGNFNVMRSNSQVDKGGWAIESMKDINGRHFAVIVSSDGSLEKTVDLEQLISWQK